jgi:ADP-ribosylglycohydrolase
MEYYNKAESIVGCLIGAAVGDALGLHCEGMSKKRRMKIFGEAGDYHFIFGRGMISDDTEHTCMVAQSLISSGGDVDKFTSALGWRLRFWAIMLPAGTGMATLKSMIKLLIGFPPSKSGVCSAGNGPAMRSAIIGASYGSDKNKMFELVRASTRVTHTDEKALYGALSVALAAHMSSVNNNREIPPQDFLAPMQTLIEGDGSNEFMDLLKDVTDSVESGHSTESYAKILGLEKGVSGYMYHTVPIVLHSWLSNQGDFSSAICEVINLGGDTDTTAAILGGIMGAGTGIKGIRDKWQDNILEWPRTVKWMKNLGEHLAESVKTRKPGSPPELSVFGLLFRNLFFFIVVLIHGFRRLLPPY